LVKCKKCGVENHPAESDYCRACQAPLHPDKSHNHSIKSKSHDHSPDLSDTTAKLTSSNEESIEKISQISNSQDHVNNNEDNQVNPDCDENEISKTEMDASEDDDLFEIKEVSFDDSSVPGLIMADAQPADSPAEDEGFRNDSDTDKIDSDTLEIENDLTLYRDDELHITMENTEEGPEIALVNRSEIQEISDVSQPELEAENSFESEPRQLSKDELKMDSSEEKSVTQKIIINPQIKNAPSVDKPVQKFAKEYSKSAVGTLSKAPPPKMDSGAPSDETKIYLPPPSEPVKISSLIKPRRIAIVSGNRITFPGGFRPTAGEEISIGDRIFELKEKQFNRWILLGGIGAAVIILVMLASFIFNPGATGNGQIVGILKNPVDGKPVADAYVTIKELDETTKTNIAGFFVFDQVPPGLYTIEVLDEGMAILSERMPVVEEKTSALSFSLPADKYSIEQLPDLDVIKTEKIAAEQETQYGFLKLQLVPSDNSKVYLDGKYIGKGSQTFKIPTGKHKVMVKHNGYKDYNYNVDIPFDKTKSYTFKLKKPKTSAKQQKKSDHDLAAKHEKNGNYNEAIIYYDKILSGDDNNLEALIGRARCYEAIDKSEQAMSNYMKAVKAANAQNDDILKLEALNGIIQLNPNHLTARYNRGLIYNDQGEYYRAAQDFSQVIKIDRRHLNAYYKLGEAYYKSQNYPAALEAYHEVQKLNFADAKPYAYMSRIYLKMGDKKNMKKSYEKFEKNADIPTKNKFDSDPEMQKIKAILGK